MKTYPEESFARLEKLETGHFWFEERNNLVIWALHKIVGNFNRFLEVGCGTGFVLRRVASEFSNADITGVEYFESALPIAKARTPRATIKQADITNLVFDAPFDVVGCFDVLEHIPDDKIALQNLANSTIPGGHLFISVPQHPWLWNLHDEQACHVRRYTRAELVEKVRDAGLEVVYVTSFMTTLLPLMVLRKLRKGSKTESAQEAGEFKPNAIVNLILRFILKVEQAIIRAGLHFTVGGSLLLVARKLA